METTPLVAVGTRLDRRSGLIEGQREGHLGSILKGQHEENTHVGIAALVVPHLGAKGSHPGREIAMNHVTLILQDIGHEFVLLVETDGPVFIHAPVGGKVELTVVGEELVAVDIPVSDGKREAATRHEVEVCVHLGESLAHHG